MFSLAEWIIWLVVLAIVTVAAAEIFDRVSERNNAQHDLNHAEIVALRFYKRNCRSLPPSVSLVNAAADIQYPVALDNRQISGWVMSFPSSNFVSLVYTGDTSEQYSGFLKSIADESNARGDVLSFTVSTKNQGDRKFQNDHRERFLELLEGDCNAI